MRTRAGLLLIATLVIVPLAWAQVPAKRARTQNQGQGEGDLVTRMLAFDKNKDGELTRAEVTDLRMKRIVDQADTDKDGVATKEELQALAAKEPPAGRDAPAAKEAPAGGAQGPGGPGRGTQARGSQGRGGAGRSGHGGPAGPPRVGQILPGFLLQNLNLTPAQKKDLDALQKDVDTRLGKILTPEQMKQLQEMSARGMAGPGGGNFGPGNFGPQGGQFPEQGFEQGGFGQDGMPPGGFVPNSGGGFPIIPGGGFPTGRPY